MHLLHSSSRSSVQPGEQQRSPAHATVHAVLRPGVLVPQQTRRASIAVWGCAVGRNQQQLQGRHGAALPSTIWKRPAVTTAASPTDGMPVTGQEQAGTWLARQLLRCRRASAVVQLLQDHPQLLEPLLRHSLGHQHVPLRQERPGGHRQTEQQQQQQQEEEEEKEGTQDRMQQQQQQQQQAVAGVDSHSQQAGQPEVHDSTAGVQQQPRRRRQRKEGPAHAVPHPLLLPLLVHLGRLVARVQLLPSEQQYLCALFTQQLLPAAAPFLPSARKGLLARLVCAVGWLGQPREQFGDGRVKNSSTGVGPKGPRSRLQQQKQTQQHKKQLVGQALATLEPAARGHQEQQQQAQKWLAQLLAWAGPPEQLPVGAHLCILYGLSAAAYRPPVEWLHASSLAAARQLPNMTVGGAAVVVQAWGQLSYRPKNEVMLVFMEWLRPELAHLTNSAMSSVLCALHDLRVMPSRAWVAAYLQHSKRRLGGFTISQLSATAGALAWAGASPGRAWAREWLLRSGMLLPAATVEEAVVLLHSAAALRLQPPVGWSHVLLLQLRGQQRQLNLRHLADVSQAVAALRLRPLVLAHHTKWMQQRLRQLSAGRQWQLLGRQEALYLLFAASELSLGLQEGWARAGLAKLAKEVGQANPAELAATLVLFSRNRQLVEEGWVVGLLASLAGQARVLSAEGLAQMLVACAALGMAPQLHLGSGGGGESVEEVTGRSAIVQGGVGGHVAALAQQLLQRLPSLELRQLSRCCRLLEQGQSGGLGWYQEVLLAAKAALGRLA